MTISLLSDMYDCYSAAIYGQLIRFCDQDELMAGEMLNQVFKTAVRDIQEFDSLHNTPFTWLVRIMIAGMKESERTNHPEPSALPAKLEWLHLFVAIP